MTLFVLNSTPIIVKWSQNHRFVDFQSLWYGNVPTAMGMSRRGTTHTLSIHQIKPHSQLVIRFTSLNSNQASLKSNQGDIHNPSSNKYQWFCPNIHQIVEDLTGNDIMTYIFRMWMSHWTNHVVSLSHLHLTHLIHPVLMGLYSISQQCWTLSVTGTLLQRTLQPRSGTEEGLHGGYVTIF